MRKVSRIIFVLLVLFSFSVVIARATIAWKKEIPKNKAFCAAYKNGGCTILVGTKKNLIISALSEDGRIEEIIEIKPIPIANCAGYSCIANHYALPPLLINGQKVFKPLKGDDIDIFGKQYAAAAKYLPPQVKKLFYGNYGIE